MNIEEIVPSEYFETDIKIKLLPRSSKNQIIGKEGDLFKVKVTSPPVEGKANKALVQLLAKNLGISKGRVEIIAGKNSRLKTLRIHGLSEKNITSLLEKG